TPRRAAGSSSAITTRHRGGAAPTLAVVAMAGVHENFLIRHAESGNRVVRRVANERQRRGIAVQCPQTLAGVLDAVSARRRHDVADADAVIAHENLERAAA